MKTVYIAHPLNGLQDPWRDQRQNVARYLRFVALAMRQEHVVLSWVHHWLLDDRGLTSGDADFYLSRDERLIELADEVWVCGPPEVSAGVQREVVWAERHAITTKQLARWMDFDFDPLAEEQDR